MKKLVFVVALGRKSLPNVHLRPRHIRMEVAEALNFNFQSLSIQFQSLLEDSELHLDDPHVFVSSRHVDMQVA